MTTRSRFGSCSKVRYSARLQLGIVLYGMLLLMIFLAAPLVLTGYDQSSSSALAVAERNRHILKQAKENLLAMAVNYAGNYGPRSAGPGHFPCPNRDLPNGTTQSEGPSPPCGGKEFISGRLPRLTRIAFSEKTVSYQTGSYNAEESFWYIVSGRFINNPLSPDTVVNPSSESSLRFDSEENIVAVILAPGKAFASQRALRPSINPVAYLENENVNSDHVFDSIYSPDENDMIEVIRKEELMPLVTKRVLADVGRWLTEYRDSKCGVVLVDNCFPAAASDTEEGCVRDQSEGWLVISGKDCEYSLFSGLLFEGVERERHWFFRNGWSRFVRYKIDPECFSEKAMICKPLSETVLVDGIEFPVINVLPIEDA